MARQSAPQRLGQLAEVGTQAFIAAGGFHRLQMDEVARRMNVGKGTVYALVEGKEALLALCLMAADDAAGLPDGSEMPLRNPGMVQMASLVGSRLSESARFPLLEAARIQMPTAQTARAHLEGVLGEVLDLMHAHRHAIKLLGAVAPDVPQLAEPWFQGGRKHLNRLLTAYLMEGAQMGLWPPPLDAAFAARTLAETLTWAGVHRYFDPDPQPVDGQIARRTVIEMLASSFIPHPHTAGNPAPTRMQS